MSKHITIRPLRTGDRTVWQKLWTDYLTFYETTVPPQVYETAFRRLLDESYREYRGLLAEIEGNAVGLAHFVFHRNLWTVEDVCYLSDLFTDPSARGRGVARALIHAVQEAANAKDVPDVYWFTQEFNYRGRMLYDQIATRTPFIVYEMHRGEPTSE